MGVKADETSQKYLETLKDNEAFLESPLSSELYEEIMNFQNQRKCLADEKIAIIDQTDQMIDACLLELEKDINKFKNYLQESHDKEEPNNEPLPVSISKKRKGNLKYNSAKKVKKVEDLSVNNMELDVDNLGREEVKTNDLSNQKQNEYHRHKWKPGYPNCFGLSETHSDDDKSYCQDNLVKARNNSK